MTRNVRTHTQRERENGIDRPCCSKANLLAPQRLDIIGQSGKSIALEPCSPAMIDARPIHFAYTETDTDTDYADDPQITSLHLLSRCTQRCDRARWAKWRCGAREVSAQIENLFKICLWLAAPILLGQWQNGALSTEWLHCKPLCKWPMCCCV